jgi:hypothetical protein
MTRVRARRARLKSRDDTRLVRIGAATAHLGKHRLRTPRREVPPAPRRCRGRPKATLRDERQPPTDSGPRPPSHVHHSGTRQRSQRGMGDRPNRSRIECYAGQVPPGGANGCGAGPGRYAGPRITSTSGGMADAPDLGSGGENRESSSLSSCTKRAIVRYHRPVGIGTFRLVAFFMTSKPSASVSSGVVFADFRCPAAATATETAAAVFGSGAS